MSQTDNTENQTTPDELTTLKARATQMGIPFHASISLEKLRTRVNEALEDNDSSEDKDAGEGEDTGSSTTTTVKAGEETRAQKHARIVAEATKLVRVVVHNNHDAKTKHEGEYFSTGNKITGTISCYVPYDNANGWHIPNAIYQMLKEKMMQRFRSYKDPVTRQEVVVPESVKQFTIEVLPDLTEKELAELAADQRARNAID